MRTPYGKECRYYYEDYNRGRETRDCRLIARSRDSLRWTSDVCRMCAVPDILRANSCSNMAIEARIVRRLRFWKRVQIDAFCMKHYREVGNPYVGCGHCGEERPEAAVFDLPLASGDSEPPQRQTESS